MGGYIPQGALRLSLKILLAVSVVFTGQVTCHGKDAVPAAEPKSLRIINQPASGAVEQLSQFYGYRISIDGQYDARYISLSIDATDMHNGIRELLRVLKIPSYTIMIDEKMKTVSVKTYPSAHFENPIQETSSRTTIDPILESAQDVDSLSSPDDETGITHSELEDLEQLYRLDQQQIDDDTIVGLESEDGMPDMSLRDLEALKVDFLQGKEQISEHDVVSPSSPGGETGITLSEREDLEQQYRLDQQQIADETIVSPESGDGMPDTSLRDWEALKADFLQGKEQISAHDFVSPSSPDGETGITLSERENLEQQYELFEQQIDDN